MINTENKTQYPELRELGFNSKLVPIQTTPYPFTAIAPEVGVAVVRDRVVSDMATFATGDDKVTKAFSELLGS